MYDDLVHLQVLVLEGDDPTRLGVLHEQVDPILTVALVLHIDDVTGLAARIHLDLARLEGGPDVMDDVEHENPPSTILGCAAISRCRPSDVARR